MALLVESGGVAVAQASPPEFHGHWVGGAILEAYKRDNRGYAFFGNAITPESNDGKGENSRFSNAAVPSTGIRMLQMHWRIKLEE